MFEASISSSILHSSYTVPSVLSFSAHSHGKKLVVKIKFENMKTKRGSVLGITEGKGPFPVIQRIKIQFYYFNVFM